MNSDFCIRIFCNGNWLNIRIFFFVLSGYYDVYNMLPGVHNKRQLSETKDCSPSYAM